MSPFLAELVGTLVLVLLGDGIVANVVLKQTKGNNAGWITIDGPPRNEIEQEDITDAEIYNMRERGNPYAA